MQTQHSEPLAAHTGQRLYPEDTTTHETLAALLKRARTGLLINTLRPPSEANQFDFWQGYAKALLDLQRGAGDALAAKDAARSGYELPGVLRAAAVCLGQDIYNLSRVEIAQRLREAGIQPTLDTVPDGDVVAAHQLEDGAVAIVYANNEHAATRVVVDDDSGLHGGSVGRGVAA